MEKRITYIDTAKGIGILLVIIGHHIMGADGLKVWINSFHMPLFFILSGIVSTKSLVSGSMKSFLKKHAISLLYPYITFSIVNLLWYILFNNIVASFDMNDFIECLIRTAVLIGYNALWFLPALFGAKVISRIVVKRNYMLIIPIVLISITLAIVAKPLGIYDYKPFTYAYLLLFRVVASSSFVLIGYKASSFIKEDFNFVRLFLYAIASIGLFQIKGDIEYNFCWCKVGNPILYYLLAIFGSLFIIEISKGITSRALTVLGRNSLIIMAIHMGYPGEIGWIIAGISHLTRLSNQIFVSSIVILIEIIICWVSVLIINKYIPILLRPYKQKGNIQTN